ADALRERGAPLVPQARPRLRDAEQIDGVALHEARLGDPDPPREAEEAARVDAERGQPAAERAREIGVRLVEVVRDHHLRALRLHQHTAGLVLEIEGPLGGVAVRDRLPVALLAALALLLDPEAIPAALDPGERRIELARPECGLALERDPAERQRA